VEVDGATRGCDQSGGEIEGQGCKKAAGLRGVQKAQLNSQEEMEKAGGDRS